MINSKEISREFLGPTNLSRAQILSIYEVAKIVMIYKEKNLVFITF